MKRIVIIPVEDDRADQVLYDFGASGEGIITGDHDVHGYEIPIPPDDQLLRDLDLLTWGDVVNVHANQLDLDDLDDMDRKRYHAAQRLRIAAGLRPNEGEGLTEIAQTLYEALSRLYNTVAHKNIHIPAEDVPALRAAGIALEEARKAADE